MVVFRADGNERIGTGHVMRCLSIADAFTRRGETSLFVTADSAMEAVIRQRGYEVRVLGSAYDCMEKELPGMGELLHACRSDTIVVDSYYVTDTYLRGLKACGTVAYLDDRAAFAYPVDILINYNAFGPEVDYGTLYQEKPPRLLLGVGYAPLRKAFCAVEKRTQPLHCRDILISTGGADPIHLTMDLVSHVKRVGPQGERIWHFLIGGMNPDKERIAAAAEGCDCIRLHCGVSDMKALICACDAAVSAAGSTTYEICACGVPMITYVLADNQKPGAEAFEKLGLAWSCGDVRKMKDAPEQIYAAVEALCEDYDGRNAMGEQMQKLVDGRGADRIAEAILHDRL